MNTVSDLHKPVLLSEVMNLLNFKDNKIIIDCTFGRGGHSQAILARLADDGRLIALDRDIEAVNAGRLILSKNKKFKIFHKNFANLDEVVKSENCMTKTDAILMDLGVSSPQLDNALRGFSFQKDGKLDMRMDNSTGQTAKELLGNLSENQLAKVLRDFGGERHAKKLARKIKLNLAQIVTTLDLSNLIAKTIGRNERKHPATRTFQALRILVNNELTNLRQGLEHAVNALKSGGLLMVISFHSLEDSIVKHFFKKTSDAILRQVPLLQNEIEAREVSRFQKVWKPILPSKQEITENPRSRSAVLRIAQKS